MVKDSSAPRTQSSRGRSRSADLHFTKSACPSRLAAPPRSRRGAFPPPRGYSCNAPPVRGGAPWSACMSGATAVPLRASPAGWTTSITRYAACPPALRISSVSFSRRSLRRAPSTTFAPWVASSLVVACPIPDDAPVMTTTLPSIMVLLLSLAQGELADGQKVASRNPPRNEHKMHGVVGSAYDRGGRTPRSRHPPRSIGPTSSDLLGPECHRSYAAGFTG